MVSMSISKPTKRSCTSRKLCAISSGLSALPSSQGRLSLGRLSRDMSAWTIIARDSNLSANSTGKPGDFSFFYSLFAPLTAKHKTRFPHLWLSKHVQFGTFTTMISAGLVEVYMIVRGESCLLYRFTWICKFWKLCYISIHFDKKVMKETPFLICRKLS